MNFSPTAIYRKLRAQFEDGYLNMLAYIIRFGTRRGDRTGTGTLAVFGQSMRIYIGGHSLPLTTTKESIHRSFVHETVWFLSGSTDVKYLIENNVNLWNSWVRPETAIYRPMTWKEVRAKVWGDQAQAIFDAGTAGLRKDENDPYPGHQCIQHLGTVYENLKSALPTTHKLVSGSIGTGAYGALWRHWSDVRIEDVSDIPAMQKRGYEVVYRPHDGDVAVMRRYIDQVQNAIDLLRSNPESRRIIVSAWNPGVLEDAVLPPCHTFWTLCSRPLTQAEYEALYPQHLGHPPVYSDAERPRGLTLNLVCRSQDFPVGTPFNIAQYAMLAHMIAHVTNHIAEELVWFGSDVHVYENQVQQAHQQLARRPFESTAYVQFNGDLKEIDDFKFENIEVKAYDNFHPKIAYPVAV